MWLDFPQIWHFEVFFDWWEVFGSVFVLKVVSGVGEQLALERLWLVLEVHEKIIIKNWDIICCKVIKNGHDIIKDLFIVLQKKVFYILEEFECQIWSNSNELSIKFNNANDF